MKSCGTIFRILAVLGIVCIAITSVVNYAIEAKSYKENYEDFLEDWEKHEEEHDEGGMYEDEDMDDCDSCESYADTDKKYDRAFITLASSTVSNFIMHAFFAGILFVLGEIASKIGGFKKAEAAPVAPVAAPVIAPSQGSYANAGVCPKCGAPRGTSDKFCGICGDVF